MTAEALPIAAPTEQAPRGPLPPTRALCALVEAARAPGGGFVPTHAALDAYRAELQAAAPADGVLARLRRLSGALGLSRLEQDVLLLCAGLQIDPELQAACESLRAPSLAGVLGAASGFFPSFAFAFGLFLERDWGAASPVGPLRRYELVTVEAGASLLSSTLRIDESVLAYLAGGTAVDPKVQSLVEWVEPPTFLCAPHEELVARIVALCGAPSGDDVPSMFQLSGEDTGAARAIAAAACARLGVELGEARCHDLPAGAAERASLARLWERQWAMSSAALLVDLGDEPDDVARAAIAFCEVLQAPLFVVAREPITLRRRAAYRMPVGRPTGGEQAEAWRWALPAGASCPPDALESIAAQFRGGWDTVRAVATALRAELPAGAAPADVGRALHDACRVTSRRRLDNLAARISSTVGWDDLVVSPQTTATLREITAQLRHRTRVYEHWGFAERSERGLGIGALFHGDSGTGKTMAAEVIANELALDLYRVDLSRVVSKYIGETEKNLRRIFDAAEESGAILLFDEADALFGRRSEVRDSHDRYANVEVSYLLSRMETYRGLAVLTTNFKQALDPAFMRRIRFVVHFPFPDVAQRAAIWSRVFPKRTPTAGLDPAMLAHLSITGGAIRNIALGAAFLAADGGQAVTPAHVLRAAATEYGKIGKSLSEAEIRGWP